MVTCTYPTAPGAPHAQAQLGHVIYNPPYAQNSALQLGWFKVMNDLIVAAFSCGLTRIATGIIDPTFVDSVPFEEWHQGVAHRALEADGERQNILCGSYRTFFQELVLDLVQKLNAVAMPDGTLLVVEIERRTVFRHFASKEALLDAFWVWINAQVTDRILPETLDELVEAPKQTFARFDEQEGIIRASLHTPSGREMRMRTIPKRREAFAAALSEVTRGLQEQDADRLVAAAHVLYSAAAWETLRDYCSLTGPEAGETVSFALRTLIEAAQRKQQPD